MSLKRKVRRGHHQNSEGSWAVSYVDMLTLLLSFFIIFYSNTQNKDADENLTPLQKIALDMSGKSGAPGAGPGAGPGNGAGTGSEKGTGHGVGGEGNQVTAGAAGTGGTGAPTGEGNQFGSNLWGKKGEAGKGNISVSQEDLALLELIKTRMAKEAGANMKMADKSLEIDFEGLSFFESGKIKLRPQAEAQLEKVIALLVKYKDIVHITVQGHTDPTQTHTSKATFSDNWELSVLRATSVLKVFLKDGFNQELLSAEGFADTRVSRLPAQTMSKEELAKLRRITLRIEPIQVKK